MSDKIKKKRKEEEEPEEIVYIEQEYEECLVVNGLDDPE